MAELVSQNAGKFSEVQAAAEDAARIVQRPIRAASVRRDRCPSSAGVNPARQLLLQPVAIGAAVEVTKSPEPSMERTVQRFREQAGRNMSERRIGLENRNAGADPADAWGRPRSSMSGEQPDPIDGPAG